MSVTRVATLCLALIGLQALAESPVAKPVVVEFVNPENFSDIRDRQFPSKPEENPHLKNLRKHMEKSAARYVGPGQTLLIKFTDIDLAGDIEPHSNPNLLDTRTVKGVYPPRAKLNYVLSDAQGAVVKSGEADLKDLGFDAHNGGMSSDPLRFDKRMLDKWLRKEFAAG
ncbi:MAG TPA: DUF3016 domain-containing protein [Xanthomonadales bacterium]|nr:DUF3016 domain-containing protein [Xanthomonadales bacterium]